MKKKLIGIVIITFNVSNLISLQINCIKKYCKEDVDIIVADNSRDMSIAKLIETQALNLGAKYAKLKSTEIDPSLSHSSACNFAYKEWSDHYNFLVFLDHDIFPIKKFSILELLENKIFAGLPQQRNGKDYFWPGFFMVNTTKVDKKYINFSPLPEFDTGGMLYHAIDFYGLDQCNFATEKYETNYIFDNADYNFYSLICNDAFMHFINSSNWNNKKTNFERVESLIKILNNYIESNKDENFNFKS